jgi:hypothetical protein
MNIKVKSSAVAIVLLMVLFLFDSNIHGQNSVSSCLTAIESDQDKSSDIAVDLALPILRNPHQRQPQRRTPPNCLKRIFGTRKS